MTSVARVEDVQIFLKDPVLLLIIYNCCVLWLYVCIEIYTLQLHTGCPTTYQTRQFFDNFTTDTFLFISHTTNVLLFKSRCNIFIGFGIIRELPGLVGSGTPYIIDLTQRGCHTLRSRVSCCARGIAKWKNVFWPFTWQIQRENDVAKLQKKKYEPFIHGHVNYINN